MSDAAFDALKKACRDQIEWLQLHASNYEQATIIHDMNLPKVVEALYELKQRHEQNGQKIIRATA